MANEVAEAVKHYLRWRGGISLMDLAMRTGYSRSYLSKMLHGRRRLQPAVVELLDDALAADGELIRIAAAQTHQPETGAAARPVLLPAGPDTFVGREDHLRRMDEAAITRDGPDIATTMVVTGGLWVGKSALAIRWAARVQDRFPGGCLYADFAASSPEGPADPGPILDRFLRALGATDILGTPSLDDRVARYRSILANRPAVIVLDDVADHAQIRYLLPGPGSAVVATSRNRQPSLLRHTAGLSVELTALDRDTALTFLRNRLGDARVDVDLIAAEALVRRCGRLPMAVNLAADYLERHPGPLARLADPLASDTDLFSSSDPNVDLDAQLGRSLQVLAGDAARMFTLAGDSPADCFDVNALAALTGLNRDSAAAIMDSLLHRHLVETVAGARLPQVRLNEVVRSHARRKAADQFTDVERRHAHDRLLAWYAATAWEASTTLGTNWTSPSVEVQQLARPADHATFEGQYDAAMNWCASHIHTALQIARYALEQENDLAWILPTLFLPYLWIAKDWSAWLTAAHHGLTAAKTLDNQLGIARGEQSLGWIHYELGRTTAIEHLEHADQLQCELGDDHSRSWTCFGLASAHMARQHYQAARDLYQQAENLFAAADFALGRSLTRAMLAGTYQGIGEPETARACATEALEGARKIGNRPAIALGHHRLGLVLLAQHQYGNALNHFDKALTMRRSNHERWSEAETLIARAETFTAIGDQQRARVSYRDAETILMGMHDPRALDTRDRIATLDSWVGRPNHRSPDCGRGAA